MKRTFGTVSCIFPLLSILLMILIMPQRCFSLKANCEHSIYIPSSPQNVPEGRVMCSVCRWISWASRRWQDLPGLALRGDRVGFTLEQCSGAPCFRHSGPGCGSTSKFVNFLTSAFPICTSGGYRNTQLKKKWRISAQPQMPLRSSRAAVAGALQCLELTKDSFSIYKELLQTNSKTQAT